MFAKRCRELIRVVPRTVTNREDAKQLARCSGSVAANYLEANAALGKKDFQMRVRIPRKEAKESKLFLRLLYTDNTDAQEMERTALVQEATELISIFGAILRKSE